MGYVFDPFKFIYVVHFICILRSNSHSIWYHNNDNVISSPGRRPWELMPWRSVRRPSVRNQLFPLNDFFSRTTRPISTKVGRKHALGMGIQICLNKETGPFWGPISCKIRKILINLQKNLLLMHHWPECIYIWLGASLGQGESSLFK